jgi:signal peptidase
LAQKQGGGDSRKAEGTLRSGLFGAILLILIALIGSLTLQWVLAFALQTSTPLHTPISRSMEPTLNVGDLLIIRGGLRAEDIHASPEDGDIIIFRSPSNPDAIPIVHRAIEKIQKDGKWYFVTKGDNNPYDDYRAFGWMVPEDYVIGKVIFVIPKVGYILRGLDETKIYIDGYAVTLRMLLMALDILALIYLELTGREEEGKNPEEERELSPKVPSNG